MYYDTVEIRPIGGRWVVAHGQMDGDRKTSSPYSPGALGTALGFFHYPRKWGVAKGFRVLREALIKRHEDEIAALKKSLSGLRSLHVPQDKE